LAYSLCCQRLAAFDIPEPVSSSGWRAFHLNFRIHLPKPFILKESAASSRQGNSHRSASVSLTGPFEKFELVLYRTPAVRRLRARVSRKRSARSAAIFFGALLGEQLLHIRGFLGAALLFRFLSKAPIQLPCGAQCIDPFHLLDTNKRLLDAIAIIRRQIVVLAITASVIVSVPGGAEPSGIVAYKLNRAFAVGKRKGWRILDGDFHSHIFCINGFDGENPTTQFQGEIVASP
jgi:hypothetical protein